MAILLMGRESEGAGGERQAPTFLVPRTPSSLVLPRPSYSLVPRTPSSLVLPCPSYTLRGTSDEERATRNERRGTSDEERATRNESRVTVNRDRRATVFSPVGA